MDIKSLLLVVAIVFRISGGAARIGFFRLPVRFLGWVVCMTATWIALSAVGAWLPLWPPLLLGVFGALVGLVWNRPAIWIVADGLSAALYGFISIPPLSSSLLIEIVSATICTGLLVDSLLIRSSQKLRAAGFAMPFLACLTLVIVKYGLIARNVRAVSEIFAPAKIIFIGMTPVHSGSRVVLKTGAVAWLDHFPSGRGPHPAALFFHGANSQASMQSSAIVARRALGDAGFIVLAVDHPGFGESKTPGPDADYDSWDPLPTALAAYDMLSEVPGVERVYAIGHSMGVTDVWRLLGRKLPKLSEAVVFGACLGDLPEKTEYWYGRFHTDRRMSYTLPEARATMIRQTFYENGPLVRSLDPDHPAVLFVRFGIENPNIVISRDELYDLIRGRKQVWDLGDSTHYFSSQEFHGVVFGDTRVARKLSSKFRSLSLIPTQSVNP